MGLVIFLFVLYTIPPILGIFWLKRIQRPVLRITLRTFVFALFFAPSVVFSGGEGAPIPAVYVLFDGLLHPEHALEMYGSEYAWFRWGLVPLAGVWAVSMAIGLLNHMVSPTRRSPGNPGRR